MLLYPLLLALMMVMTPTTAQAYIDPGSGALVVQLLLGAVATAVVTVKFWWTSFLGLFKKNQPTMNEKKDGRERGEPDGQ